MKKYFLLIMFTTIFTQDNIQKSNEENENLFSLKGFKVGLDLGGEFELSAEGMTIGSDTDTGFALAVEFYTGTDFEIGIEYLADTDLDLGGSFSHMSFYGLYSLFNDNKMNLKAKFGYSTLDLNDSSSGYYGTTIDSDGGIMYGLQLDLSNNIHLSYTIHDGEYSLDSYYYYYDNSSKVSTSTTRFNIAYLFNL